MLYDTFGFPLEITQEVAAERGVDVDQAGFEQAMETQRATSQAAAVSVDVTADSVFAAVRLGAHGSPDTSRSHNARNDAPQIADSIGETDFAGYTALSTQATVRALLVEGKPASSARAGQAVEIVLDRSPFYAESGGQVGDKGLLHVAHDTGQLSVEVSDVQKVGGGRLFLHYGTVVGDGELTVGALVKATVDSALRRRVRACCLAYSHPSPCLHLTRMTQARCNHTATHLLQAALKQVMGDDISQAGSLVDFERLRFDFNSREAPTPAQLARVETLVNGASTLAM